jgi:NodT family efflux transporter outer membrane factor (OMF) lipoprotein
MSPRLPLALVVAGLLAAAGGCALKAPAPADQLRGQALPHMALPAAWTSAGAAAGAVQGNWVANFKEPALDSLVVEALAYNADLRLAEARVQQAAGYAELAGATLYPQVNLMARGGGKFGGDGSGLNGWLVSLSWELDLWGRVRAQQATGRSQFEASEFDLVYARQSIAALVVKSWVLAVTAAQQKAQAEAMVASSERLVSLAGERVRVGSGNELDVAVAQAALGGYRDAVQQFELARQQAVRALEVLVGRYPGTQLQAGTTLPGPPAPIPAGLPSELLERRPDVVAAQRRLDAAFYNVEQAKAARLPRISLTAGVNSISSETFILKNSSNPVWGAGASILAPIYLGGALQAQVEIADATQRMALADYGRVGAKAFAEVEEALSGGFTADARAALQSTVVAERERAVRLAQERYRVGSGDLRAVSQEELALFSARTALIQLRAEQLVQRASLYLALGGDFGTAPMPSAPAVAQRQP